MRAKVDGVQLDTLRRQECVQALMDLLQPGLVEVTAADARLVRGDEQAKPEPAPTGWGPRRE